MLKPPESSPDLGFYESDGQEDIPPPLIAKRLALAPSAPCGEGPRLWGAAGVAGQSASSASVSSLVLPILAGRSASAVGSHDDANHGSIRDSARGRPDASSGSARGPTVRRGPPPTAGRTKPPLRHVPCHRPPGTWTAVAPTAPPPA